MATYLIQATYTSEAFQTLVKKPQDRTAAIRATVEKLGGSLIGLWGSLGVYDIVLIVDLPDTVSAAAFKIAAQAGGALSSATIAQLLSPEEGIAAFRKAAGSGYKPPKSR